MAFKKRLATLINNSLASLFKIDRCQLFIILAGGHLVYHPLLSLPLLPARPLTASEYRVVGDKNL